MGAVAAFIGKLAMATLHELLPRIVLRNRHGTTPGREVDRARAWASHMILVLAMLFFAVTAVVLAWLTLRDL